MGDVADQEDLYRRVRKDACKTVGDSLKLSSTAFNDLSKQPSVDRVSMRASPQESQWEPTDGIALLLTEEVRAIVIPVTSAPRDKPAQFVVDVWARPLEENPAHAQIEATPEFTKSRFDKLKEALVRLAEKRGWVIEPT
jgi:hypothetical protein